MNSRELSRALNESRVIVLNCQHGRPDDTLDGVLMGMTRGIKSNPRTKSLTLSVTNEGRCSLDALVAADIMPMIRSPF